MWSTNLGAASSASVSNTTEGAMAGCNTDDPLFKHFNSVAEIPNVQKLGDGHYEVRVTYLKQPSGTRKELKRRVHGDLDDALAIRSELKFAAREGRPSSIDPDSATVEKLYEKFDELRQGRGRWSVAPSTYMTSKKVYEKRILPFAGEWRVADIRRSDINRLIDHWTQMDKERGSGKYAAATINKWVRNLRVLLRFCFERIDRDPGVLSRIRGLSESGTEKQGRSLSEDERDLFLATARELVPDYFALLHTLLTTGQRWGSVTALRWEDLDWEDAEHGSLRFERSHYQGVVKRGSKTGRTITLPMTASLADAIRTHEDRFRGIESHPGFRTTNLMFPAKVEAGEAKRNGFLGPDTGRGICHKICEEAGIEPKITPHDLRRTMVTLSLERGMSPEQVKSVTGHCSAMIEHYMHSTDSGRRAVLEAADGSGSD